MAMTLAPLVLFLPLLHKDTNHNNAPLPALHICPGLPHTEQGYWQADTYPFSAKEAEALLRDLANMSEAALTGIPLQALATMQNSTNRLRDIEEQEDLQNFVNKGALPTHNHTPTENTLRQAQRFLLWSWLLEERYREVRTLSEEYTKNAALLVHALHVEHDKNLMELENIENALAHTESPLPPWQLVLENIAYFLPQKTYIVINHAHMADAVREHAPLMPLQPESIHMLKLDADKNTAQWHEATLSIATLLQSTKQGTCLQKELHCFIREHI